MNPYVSRTFCYVEITAANNNPVIFCYVPLVSYENAALINSQLTCDSTVICPCVRDDIAPERLISPLSCNSIKHRRVVHLKKGLVHLETCSIIANTLVPAQQDHFTVAIVALTY